MAFMTVRAGNSAVILYPRLPCDRHHATMLLPFPCRVQLRHADSVLCTTACDDVDCVVTGCQDNAIRVWYATPPSQSLSAARARPVIERIVVA